MKLIRGIKSDTCHLYLFNIQYGNLIDTVSNTNEVIKAIGSRPDAFTRKDDQEDIIPTLKIQNVTVHREEAQEYNKLLNSIIASENEDFINECLSVIQESDKKSQEISNKMGELIEEIKDGNIEESAQVEQHKKPVVQFQNVVHVRENTFGIDELNKIYGEIEEDEINEVYWKAEFSDDEETKENKNYDKGLTEPAYV
jgi:hypothetical protein